MEKPIIRDEAFLAQKSQPVTFMDIAVAQDLLDTLAAHADRCVSRQVYDGGGLPVAGGRACCSALRKNYGCLSGYAV